MPACTRPRHTLDAMSRAPRVQFAGIVAHVTSRGAAGRAIYPDDGDRYSFLSIFERLLDRHGWLCHAYCLMTTHYHLLIETVEADLACGMKWLNGLYAQSFNRRHGTRGHLFEARYHSELILTEAHFLHACRYIALNPVRAGLCEEPHDWPWSSYSVVLGRAIGIEPSWPMLEHFGRDRAIAIEGFRRFVQAGLDRAIAAS